MKTDIKLFDVVALTADVPESSVVRGQMGTIVDVLEPGMFLVEFSDSDGETYAIAPLRTDQLLVLLKEPVGAA